MKTRSGFTNLAFNLILGIFSILVGSWIVSVDPIAALALFIIGVDNIKDAYHDYAGITPTGAYKYVNILFETGSLVFSVYMLVVSLKMIIYYMLPFYIVMAFITVMAAATSIHDLLTANNEQVLHKINDYKSKYID